MNNMRTVMVMVTAHLTCEYLPDIYYLRVFTWCMLPGNIYLGIFT